MMDLQIGQVLWLKIRFNNYGDISEVEHPYLIVDITTDGIQTVEVGQIDSLKPYMLAYKSNKAIFVTRPNETVLYKDSYIQLNNKLVIEYFDGLSAFRRTTNLLSRGRLADVLKAYKNYHANNIIDPERSVYLTREEILKYNS